MNGLNAQWEQIRVAANQQCLRDISALLWEDLLPEYWRGHPAEAPPSLTSNQVHGGAQAVNNIELADSRKLQAAASVEAAKIRVSEIITGRHQQTKRIKNKQVKQVLGLLHCSEFRILSRPEIVHAICAAMVSNNADFFIALGKALEHTTEPLSSYLDRSNISKFTFYLILNWTRYDVLPLCLLSIPDIRKVSLFCGLSTPNEPNTRKTIERLKLKRPMQRSRLHVTVGHGTLFVNV